MADRFDLDAIEADDALLDLLAAGGESAWRAGEHDPALKLLADLRLAVEVEGELPVEAIDDPESFLARCAALNPVTDPFARKLAARSLALGVAAVAALSVSGVAAAVTGNPLSPYEKVIEKIADGLRPETSLPKEQLDGLPAFDKTKIVKVGKDYRKTQEQRRDQEDKASNVVANAADEPAQSVVVAQPPFLVPPPAVDKTSAIETPIVVEPAKPKPPDPVPSSDPTGQPTTQPTDGPTTEPTTQPTGDPTTQPTEPPATTPVTPPPSETTEPATTTTPPPSGNGSTGEPGGTPVDQPTGPTTPVLPSTPPDTGGETSTGSDNETPPGDQSGDPKGDVPTGDLPVVNLPLGDESGDQGSEPVLELVENVLPVLPTPTGAPVEEPARLEEYFGKGFTGNGKHSSGKPALGWAKSQYAKGKHSTGHYAEGKHAAIARAHGSVAPVTIRQILGVLNTPMSDR